MPRITRNKVYRRPLAGPALCDAVLCEDAGTHSSDCAVTGDWHRRQHRDLQRYQYTPAQALALSPSIPARHSLAALTRHWYSPGLALARTISRYRYPEPRI